MAIKPTTVNDLIERLQLLKEQGFGEAEIVLSSDKEWNHLRHLWNSQICKFDNEKPNLDIKESLEDCCIETNNKRVILG
jgi:hypothetical protein